jgi:hypothetical protein
LGTWLAVLACALWAGVASAASGQLELCKAGDNGAAGQTFKIAYQKGSTGSPTSVTVTGGTCNAAVSVPVGTYILTEDLSSGQWVMSGDSVVPSSAWVSDNTKRGTLKVTVVANAETQATFVNSPAGATVKVCKWSASTQLQGAQYSFNVNGQTVTATAGKNAAGAGCSTALATLPGTRLKIQESIPANEQVTGVTFNGATVSATNGLVRVTATTGANVVVFENEPVGPPQTGYIEICKDSDGDPYLSGSDSFEFTITDHAGLTDTEHVFVGQCSGPIKVAAGNVNVAETPTGGTSVKSITTLPNANALGPINLTNGTATVVVPVSSDPSGEVQVHYVNKTVTATLKVCKVLTSTSGALAGKTFGFDVFSRSVTDVDELTITATAGATGACKIFFAQLPVGSTATVTEAGMPYVSADGQPAGTGDSQTITIQPGINIVSFTNQAMGQLEICKSMQLAPTDDSAFNGTVFDFVVDGATHGPLADVKVAAGHCSQPLIVSVGSHTVNETPIPHGFQFVSSTATGPTGDNRIVSGTNPVTVSVPFFGDATNGGETLVTFINKVQRANLKLCKAIDPGSLTALKKMSFNIFWTFGNDTESDSGLEELDPPFPSCTGLLGGPYGLPIINTDGTPALIITVESGDGFQVKTITVSGGVFDPSFDPNPDLEVGEAVIDPGPGVVVVTYTNEWAPPSE